MSTSQLSIFKRKTFPAWITKQRAEVEKPTADKSILGTLGAYYAYLCSGRYAKHTPNQFFSDVKAIGLYLRDKKISDITTQDIQQWVGLLKRNMAHPYAPKTISRKLSAINSYFVWLQTEEVIKDNPAQAIRNFRITPPLPDILFESECKRLLSTASKDSRTYLLFLILLQTGIKKAELMELTVNNFDFSDSYNPEVWIKHSGTKVRKDRKLKLPPEIVPVFGEYTQKYQITDVLFPYSERFIELLISDTARLTGLTKRVSAQILRDSFAVLCLKRGEDVDFLLTKLGLSETTWEEAREKYLKLSSKGL